jgi:hypothetical protein
MSGHHSRGGSDEYGLAVEPSHASSIQVEFVSVAAILPPQTPRIEKMPDDLRTEPGQGSRPLAGGREIIEIEHTNRVTPEHLENLRLGQAF